MSANESSIGGAIGTPPTPDAVVATTEQTTIPKPADFVKGNQLPEFKWGNEGTATQTSPTPDSPAPTPAVQPETPTMPAPAGATPETPSPWVPSVSRKPEQLGTTAQATETTPVATPPNISQELTPYPSDTSTNTAPVTTELSPSGAPILPSTEATVTTPPTEAVAKNEPSPFPTPSTTSGETASAQNTAATSNEGNVTGLTPYPDVTDTSNNQKGDTSASLLAGNTPPAEAGQPAPVDATATVAPEIPAPTPINVEAAATTDSKATIPASTESGTAPATTPDVNSSLPPESASFLSSLGYGTGAEANSAGADNEPKAETPVHKEINPQAAMKGLGEQIKKAEEEEKELDIEKVNKEKLKKAKLLFFSILQDMDPVTQKNLLEDIFNLLYSTDINQFKQTEEKKAA